MEKVIPTLSKLLPLKSTYFNGSRGHWHSNFRDKTSVALDDGFHILTVQWVYLAKTIFSN